MTQQLPHRQVGRLNLKVPLLGLGTGAFARLPQAQVTDTVHYALAQGVTFIDTAPMYRSEALLGAALAGVPRDSYVLSTKIGRLVQPDGNVIIDYSPDGVRRSLEDSLKRLRLDYVDILHIHDADAHYEPAIQQAYPTLAALRAEGVIKAVGAGMNQWQMLLDFAHNGDFDCFLLAGRYTLIEQTALDALRYFQTHNISIFAGGVYNSGILATGAVADARYNYAPAPAPIIDKVRRIEALCATHAVPLKAAALQFVLAHPAMTALIVGAWTREEVAENLALLDFDIPADFWHALRAAGLIDPTAPLPGEHEP